MMVSEIQVMRSQWRNTSSKVFLWGIQFSKNDAFPFMMVMVQQFQIPFHPNDCPSFSLVLGLILLLLGAVMFLGAGSLLLLMVSPADRAIAMSSWRSPDGWMMQLSTASSCSRFVTSVTNGGRDSSLKYWWDGPSMMMCMNLLAMTSFMLWKHSLHLVWMPWWVAVISSSFAFSCFGNKVMIEFLREKYVEFIPCWHQQLRR